MLGVSLLKFQKMNKNIEARSKIVELDIKIKSEIK